MEGIKTMRKVITKLINPQQAHIVAKIVRQTSLREAVVGCEE